MDSEMNDDQANAILAALREIRDRLPVPAPVFPRGGVTGRPYFAGVAFEPPAAGCGHGCTEGHNCAGPAGAMPTYSVDAIFPGAHGRPAVKPVEGAKGSELAAAKRMALLAVLDALDGWIETAYNDHKASGHRAEPVGAECWRQFEPSDIRRMVNDACIEVGLKPFPEPRNPTEDSPGE
jgi:hypothetical protein